MRTGYVVFTDYNEPCFCLTAKITVYRLDFLFFVLYNNGNSLTQFTEPPNDLTPNDL